MKKAYTCFAAPKTTPPKPTQPPPPTTTPPPVMCKLPDVPYGLSYEISDALVGEEEVSVGTSVVYSCNLPGTEARDGDIIHTCTGRGQFQGRVPLCVSGMYVTCILGTIREVGG